MRLFRYGLLRRRDRFQADSLWRCGLRRRVPVCSGWWSLGVHLSSSCIWVDTSVAASLEVCVVTLAYLFESWNSGVGDSFNLLSRWQPSLSLFMATSYSGMQNMQPSLASSILP